MDNKTQGAWIIHHTRKLQAINDAVGGLENKFTGPTRRAACYPVSATYSITLCAPNSSRP